MMKLQNLVKVINGKKYETAKAIVIAHNCYWDGHNFERNGRNIWLLKTPNGNYFLQHQSLWQGEHDYIEPISLEEAVQWYETMPVAEMEFEEAFPDVIIEEA